MTADLQTTVSGMSRMVEADLPHLTGEVIDDMGDIAAGRLVDPDEQISPPPSVVALATGVSVEDVVAARTRPKPPALPSQPPWDVDAAALSDDIRAHAARRYGEIRERVDAGAQQTIENCRREAAERIAGLRRRLGLDGRARQEEIASAKLR